MAKYKGTPEDLVEFGSDEETGNPCVGSLIRGLPEKITSCEGRMTVFARVNYRADRRAFVEKMCDLLSLKPCTYREYMLGLTEKRGETQ